MALTKIQGGVVKDTAQLNITSVNATGVITATGGMQAIGIFSGGTAVHTGVITALNFVGTGNTFVVHNNRVDISISGGEGVGAISDQLDKIVFFYYGGFSTNRTISSPNKFGEVYTHVDATVDIEDGITVTVDDNCVLALTDTTEYLFFSNPTEQTNPLKLASFADNVRTTFTQNVSLVGDKKVGYIILPSAYENDVPIDIENGVEVIIGDQAVLIV